MYKNNYKYYQILYAYGEFYMTNSTVECREVIELAYKYGNLHLPG